MTGFGRGQAALSGGRLVVELRTVNHRYQDTRLHLPPELVVVDEDVDRRLRAAFARGRIELTMRLQGKAPVSIRLDTDLARSCLEELDALRRDMGLQEAVSINMLATVPQVFIQEATFDDDELKAATLDAVDQAIEAAEAMRIREAEALAIDFEERLQLVSNLVTTLLELSENVAPQAVERLRLRLERLVTEGHLDEWRLAQEAAILADRADVIEELTRLRSHVDQFRTISREPGPVGRRLDFLLQEMTREASTIGSKAQEASLQHLVVDLKGELARMREQIQNIE